jgi:DNA-binding NarL/FixJ family response regulator
LADDHTLVAEAFKKLLEPEFDVVGIVENGREFLRAAVELKPDLALIDLNMPLLNGLDAGAQCKELLPGTKIIVLTMTEDADIAEEAMKKWASGYLLKKSAGSELLKAVKEVLAGQVYMTPAVKLDHLESAPARLTKSENGKELTTRQREVLQLLAEGHTMKEAAAILHVATRTVAFHKYRIMEEFKLHTNSELLRFAIKQKLVT